LLEDEIDSMQQDILKLREAIDMGMVKQDMGTSRIAMLQKELRGTIKQLSDERVLLDKQGLILAGADRALREMLSIFRDDPIEGPLTEASMGVWTKILQEES
jgi:predicted  nucleic acid-binding Zn-ribbon protein